MRTLICVPSALLGVAAALLLAGCRTAHIPLPDTLAATQRLSVEGRQGSRIKEHLRFGPYEAYSIDRSWVKGRDLQILAYEGNRRKQQYTFVLREGTTEHWSVSCEAFLRAQTIHTEIIEVELTNRTDVACRFRSPDDPVGDWRLDLTEDGDQPLEGRLSQGDAVLDVRGTRALEKGLRAETTTGYHLLQAGRAVAAVEVINDGAVWLPDEAPPGLRHVLSATAAALLLLEDLRAHLPGATA